MRSLLKREPSYPFVTFPQRSLEREDSAFDDWHLAWRGTGGASGKLPRDTPAKGFQSGCPSKEAVRLTPPDTSRPTEDTLQTSRVADFRAMVLQPDIWSDDCAIDHALAIQKAKYPYVGGLYTTTSLHQPRAHIMEVDVHCRCRQTLRQVESAKWKSLGDTYLKEQRERERDGVREVEQQGAQKEIEDFWSRSCVKGKRGNFQTLQSTSSGSSSLEEAFSQPGPSNFSAIPITSTCSHEPVRIDSPRVAPPPGPLSQTARCSSPLDLSHQPGPPSQPPARKARKKRQREEVAYFEEKVLQALTHKSDHVTITMEPYIHTYIFT
ncbi:hypothetical protein JZ751_017185 [Albula glossodonta]|uniref:Uncharacterized protein n=1 Tax=Albula glossodonta TaxID=121402 RepID=A0A8T2NP98_9TELE|nr:hypothetical protein JZ751_017185 [Albula glossodonta]